MLMYDELAAWWRLISPVADYEDECKFFRKVIEERVKANAPTLLELGSGGGNNAYYLKTLFAQTTLSDLSPQMLHVSGELNPDCEHVQGDMRTLRLGRTFDVVFIHDAIDYMITTQALYEAIETAWVHCKSGGVAMFVPDHVRETFEEGTEQDGHDEGDRALRYLEWTYDPDPNDTMYTTDYVYLLREGTQPVRVLHDRHVCGVFSREEWVRMLKGAGFEAEILPDPFGREVFVGRKT
jgi:trans-aconitate methyltransferase